MCNLRARVRSSVEAVRCNLRARVRSTVEAVRCHLRARVRSSVLLSCNGALNTTSSTKSVLLLTRRQN